MNEQEKIEVRIDKTGNVKIHVVGIKGEGCLAITQGLEQALGGQVTNRDYTNEYFEKEGEGENAHGYA